MRMRLVGLVAIGAVGALGLAACGGSSSGGGSSSSSSGAAGASSSSGGVQVGVILPDTQSSQRWESFDKPYLKQAFDAAGIKADIQNAQGDKNKFATIADSMIQEGVKVLIIDEPRQRVGRPGRDQGRRTPASRPSTTTG